MLVNDLNIQPSEAWALDFKEIKHLTGLNDVDKQDLSLMLNVERQMNGCPTELLT